MSDNTRTLILICCSLLQIVGLPIIILWGISKPQKANWVSGFLRISVGICGAASVVKFFVLKEVSNLNVIVGLAGLGIILIVYFTSPRKRKKDEKKKQN